MRRPVPAMSYPSGNHYDDELIVITGESMAKDTSYGTYAKGPAGCSRVVVQVTWHHIRRQNGTDRDGDAVQTMAPVWCLMTMSEERCRTTPAVAGIVLEQIPPEPLTE